MEKEVEILFTEDIILQGAKLFHLQSDSLEKLGGFENYVLLGKRENQEFILRFTHSSHRSKKQVEAELAWLQFLKQKAAPVCGPFTSINGNLVEEVAAKDTFFFVSLFEKASGSPIKVNEPNFNKELFYAWGKATGILHRLSSEYTEADYVEKRPDLVEEFSQQFEPFLPNDKEIIRNVKTVLESVKKLPKDKERYRLIHSDIHSGNFFYDGNNIIIFDFDDCSYHHLISDIAIAIYYAAWFKLNDHDNRTTFINEEFLPAFLKGYRSEHKITDQLLVDIPLFLKLRDCELYGVLHKKWDLTSLTEKQENLLLEIKNRIISNTTIVSLQL